MNVSGGAIIKTAKNVTEARRLLEFLSGDLAQFMYAQVNHEYPVKPGVQLSGIVKSFGSNQDGIKNGDFKKQRNRQERSSCDEAGYSLKSVLRTVPPRPFRGSLRLGSMRSLAQAIIGRLHVLTRPEVFVPDKTVEGRIEGIDIVDVRFLGNFKPSQMVAGIDHQPAQVFANQVNRSAHSGAESGAALTIRSLVGMQPCEGLHGIVLLALDVL